MGPSHNLSFCACKTAWLAPALLVSIEPNLHLWFLRAKQQLLYQSTSLYVFQPSSVFLCMQNSTFRTRLTSLYGSQSSSVLWAHITACLAQEYKVYMGSNPHLWFCACKTAWLASELLVSMGPSTHVWFMDAKQRLLDRNNKSLWVPDITCRFVHGKQRD